MKRIYFIILLWLSGLNLSNAQAYEIGLNLGGGNYIGDIGQEYYFKPNKIGFSGVFKRTINPWYSIRLNLQYFQIDANDADAESLGRQNRLLSTQGQIFNFSAGFEYNFVPRNPFLPLKSLHRLTPYMFTGFGIGSYFGNLYKGKNKNSLNLIHKFNGANLNIPMILGVKFKMSRHLIFSLEAGAYYYFTDNLDGTASFYRRNNNSKNTLVIPTTNLNSNDWYTFSSFGFIYTFGDLNCYFNLF
jgi:hypothetical protein